MNSTLKNVLAVIIGIVVGSGINMGIVTIGPSIIPNPEGFDNTTMEALQETFHLMKPVHYIVPWLAHALGTLAAALVTVIVAFSNHFKLAMIVGGFFFLGGVYMIYSIPSTPIWFSIIDLVSAYIPMGKFQIIEVARYIFISHNI
ncbi:MAG: hypothetical protein P8M34_10115 [Saprospiraceae bacterium]|nr:hypothetical protein [Saprospiraceae bacterium]